jgi:hypothetical protein
LDGPVREDRPDRRAVQSCRLAGNQDQVGAMSLDHFGDHRHRHVRQNCKRGDDLIEPCGFGKSDDCCLIQLIEALHPLHDLFGAGEVARRQAVSACRVRDRLENALYFRLKFGRSNRHQSGADRVGRRSQEIAEKFEGKIDAKSENFDESVVGLGMLHHSGVAGFRKPCGAVVGKLADDPAFATIDDDVGHDLRQVGAAGYREQKKRKLRKSTSIHARLLNIVPVEKPRLSGPDIREPPDAQTLVAPAAAGLQAILVEQFNRRPPLKRCALEVQRAPVAVLTVAVELPFRKGRRDQPRRVRSRKIRNCAFDIRKRQMDQTVATQDGVAPGQPIKGDVGEMIFAADRACDGAGLQAIDQIRHDIDADIAHAQIGGADPAGIAAGRIEQRGDCEFVKQPRQFRPQRGGCVDLGAQAGHRCHSTPQIGFVDPPKALRQAQTCKGLPVHNKALMRENGWAGCITG